MERRALSVAIVAGSLLLSGLLAGKAGAADPLEAMGVLRPAAPEPAPDIAFTTIDGREVRIRDFRGKRILLGFFTTW